MNCSRTQRTDRYDHRAGGSYRRVEHLRIERELPPVALAQFLQPLEQAAIDENAFAGRGHEKMASDDGFGSAKKSQHRWVSTYESILGKLKSRHAPASLARSDAVIPRNS